MVKPSILPLQLDQVSLTLGDQVQVLSKLSVQIEPGSRNVIIGPNGAGKSALLRVMHGLIQPSTGLVSWARQDKFAQAMVFQRPVMLRRTVRENIAYALDLRNASNATERMNQVLLHTGLSSLADRPARHCSVGEQQKIALARAWALNPEVLFLDEPTASLDPSATKAIEKIVLDMHAAGTTIIMTTHDLGQAKRIAQRVIFLHQGQLVDDAVAQRFFSQAGSRQAQAFIQGDLL